MQAWSDVQLKAAAMTELGQQRLNEEQKVAVASMLLGVAGGASLRTEWTPRHWEDGDSGGDGAAGETCAEPG